MQESKMLSVIDGEKLLALDIEPPRFIVAKLIPTGLHLLAGSPKIGKSWLSLWLYNQVSHGENVWGFDTMRCGTLYISLEDTLDRLHLRLSRITDSGSKDIYFATSAYSLSDGLIEQLELFIKEYPDTDMIVIDTFQRIRDEDLDSTYANDYKEIKKIKSLADNARIAILLVHHLRKAQDSDPFNMVSGLTGIIGAVDSIFVLEKHKRVDKAAILHVTGRDIEDMQIMLEFEKEPPVWKLTGFGTGNGGADDTIVKSLVSFMSERDEYTGTASELYSLLGDNKIIDGDSGINVNILTRKIKENMLTLEKTSHIKASFTRTNTARKIFLKKVTGDGIFTVDTPDAQ